MDRILIAVDDSDGAKRAATVGLSIARAYGATVDVIHAVETPTVRSEEVVEWQRERGGELLSAVEEEAADLDVSTHLIEDEPSTAIRERAETSGADLIVVGRSGRGGLGERLLGSVAERVLHRSDVPVLTVPAAGAPADGIEIDDVLATTDGSDAALRAAPVAAGLADQVGATLHVLTAVDVARSGGLFNAGGVSESFVERLEERSRGFVDEFAERARETAGHLDVSTAVVRGQPHAAVSDYVENNDVDVVVMASRGESSLPGHLLGSVADRVLRVSEVPVVIVPVRD